MTSLPPAIADQDSISPKSRFLLTTLYGYDALVSGVESGDSAAIEALYEWVGLRTRLLFVRQLGLDPAAETLDHVHDVFLTVWGILRRGTMRDPNALPGLILTVARRHIAQTIDKRIRRRATISEYYVASDVDVTDDRPSSLADILAKETAELMSRALRDLPPDQQEVLIRFYFLGQEPADIAAAMRLGIWAYYNKKYRAKQKLEARVREMLATFPTAKAA